MQDRRYRKWYNNDGNMDGKQKYGKMHSWKANKSMGKCRNMTYNGENGKKLGSSVENTIKTQEMRAKAWENAG